MPVGNPHLALWELYNCAGQLISVATLQFAPMQNRFSQQAQDAGAARQ